METTLEKSMEEISQDMNNNDITADDHTDAPENQEEHIENFFSDSEEEIIQNSCKYEKILSHTKNNDGKVSYLVKYPYLSYHHVEWVSEEEIQKEENGQELIAKYRLLYPEGSDPPETPFDPQYLTIEKLISSQQEENGSRSYLTKWCNLNYQNLTWEPESSIPQNFINDFQKNNQIPDFKEQFIRRKTDYSTWAPFNVPNFSPKKYQIEGMKYIAHSFCNEQNVIISDEIGLGSSIQCAMFLKWLISNESNRGPFLIIATEKRINEWKDSLEKLKFGPVLTFLKPKIQRDTIAEYELFYTGTKLAKMNLILSNFSIQVNDKILSEVSWQSIFIDTSHFSSDEEMERCLTQDFFDLLSKFESSFTVLITQFQNDSLNLLKNYFCILYKNLAKVALDFTQQLSEQNQTIIFKSSLQSLVLKRTFTEVNNIQHPITEYIIDCGLTEMQLDYSESIYQKLISYIVKRNNGYFLRKIFSDIELICTHPYLHQGAQESIFLCKKFSDLSKEADQSVNEFSHKSLIENSTKMKFLHKIVNHIKANKKKNKRLIVLSHHETVLDLIQEYFEYEGIFYERISNGTRGEQRDNAIKKFNMACSIDFAFLMSFKSGIEGIKLNSVDDIILIDSDLNPKKDIESIINMTSSPNLVIYRLLPSRTIERLKYDRLLLKLANPDEDNLTINGEISTLLGLGIDLHDTIEYANDSIEEILDRSARNYYESIKDPKLTYSNSPKFDLTDKSKNSPWSNFVPYMVKEDFMNDKFSSLHSTQPSSIYWTSERLMALSEGLIRFGWGRWSTILTKYKETLNEACDFEMAAICRIFINIFLKSTKNSFPIVSSIYGQPLSPQASKFEERFKKDNSNLNMVSFIKGCDEKLSSIEFMYMINVIVLTCPKPPEEIVVPYIETMDDDSWDEDADRHLIHHIYKNGYMRFGNTPLNKSFLEFRAKLIVETLKKRFILYHELKNNSSQFEHFSLLRACNMMTREEQQQFTQFLVYYGWTSPEDFKQITGSYRSPKELNVIHEVIINFCKGKKEMINDLAESIPSCISRLILQREKLLFKVRNELKKEDVKPLDWPIIEYVKENGFIDLVSCEEIRQRFGTKATSIEYKVTIFLLKYFHNFQLFPSQQNDVSFNQKSQIVLYDDKNNDQERLHLSSSSSSHLKSKVTSQVNISYDKEGNPIMPIEITPSLTIVNLGEIVTEKPNFYNNRYIYPKNFTSLKMYKSTINPNDRVWYKSTIIDDGTDSPLFRVEMKDDPSICFEGRAPSKPWLEVLTVINEKKKEVGLPKSKKVTVSGPEYFGLASPIVLSLIQKMKGADICLNYGKVESISPSSSTLAIESKPENNDEGASNIAVSPSSSVTLAEDDLDENGMLKIVPRKRANKISYAESSSSSFSESDEEVKEENDKDFNAAEGNDDDDDDDDENEPFDEEDDDFNAENNEVDEFDENEFVEQKKGSSRASRTSSSSHSFISQNPSGTISTSNGKANSNDDGNNENCAIQ